MSQTFSRYARGGRRGAVLAVRPDARSLHRAADLARGSALVVLESHPTPLIGWAAGAAARDLSGVQPDVPALHPDAKAALDRALFFTGATTGPAGTNASTRETSWSPWCAAD